ncbi:retropepsin-like aspartic protease, partial [Streptomyces sundarbansensis]
SANYISPRLLDGKMKVLPLRSCREVETAGGHITKIDQKVDFKLCAQQLSYRVQAYVFDMKFDIILGQQWFQQAKPIPQWSTSSWVLPVGTRSTVTLSPCDNSLNQDSINGAQDFAYLISKRQLQRCARKKDVEELYLVHFVDGDHNKTDSGESSSELERAIKTEFQDVFRNDLPPGLPPIRTVEHVIHTGDAKPI